MMLSPQKGWPALPQKRLHLKSSRDSHFYKADAISMRFDQPADICKPQKNRGMVVIWMKADPFQPLQVSVKNDLHCTLPYH